MPQRPSIWPDANRCSSQSVPTPYLSLFATPAKATDQDSRQLPREVVEQRSHRKPIGRTSPQVGHHGLRISEGHPKRSEKQEVPNTTIITRGGDVGWHQKKMSRIRRDLGICRIMCERGSFVRRRR